MELEEIRNKLTSIQYNFLYDLKEYINLPIYFIGSILRYDYFKGYSDLDIVLFSHDPNYTKIQIKQFLNHNNPDKFVFVNEGKYPISGYKLDYDNRQQNEEKIEFDLFIFKETSKNILSNNRAAMGDISYIVIIYFLIIKILHFYVGIINNTMYKYLKDKIWSFINKTSTPIIITKYDEYQNLYINVFPDVKNMVNYN